MKVVLEGEHAEVMALIQSLAGKAIDSVQIVRAQVEAAAHEVETQVAEVPPLFHTLVTDWVEGFNLDGTAHWDDEDQTPKVHKGEALRDLGNSRRAGATIKWVQQQGGLTHAVQNILNGDTELSRGIAMNMAQVASILFPDLAQTLEHFDPFED